ncbi:MAG TPA: element excision factor XisH family protein [Allocoleopsis sp.]
MSAKDRFHQSVKNALIKEKWIITHDPLPLDFDNARIEVDLGAERLIAAEKDLEKIAVEVKSFLAASTIYEFHLAIGQCFSYHIALREQQPERQLYLAVPIFTYQEFFCRPFAQKTIKEAQISLIVYHPIEEVIVQWIS